MGADGDKAAAAGADGGHQAWGDPANADAGGGAGGGPPIYDDATCSSEEPPPVPSKVCGRYEIRGQLGSGSYSVVHLGYDTVMYEDVAVKFEWVSAKKGRKLLHEAQLLVSMAEWPGAYGFPRVRWWGNEDQYNIMVMERLGPSLEQLFKSGGKRFSLKTTVMLAEQMLDRIEFVHSCGIVHRDIKPHNFLIGTGESGKTRVYIMDFGLAKRYVDPETGDHIPCVRKKGVTGTVRYTTLNVHRGLEPSRRDDLGAIGYVLMQFLLGTLPWQGISAPSNRTKQKRIGRKKRQTTHDELCRGFPDELSTWLKYCDALPYAEKPNYNYLRGLLRDIRMKQEFDLDGKFDWVACPENKVLHAPRASTKDHDKVGVEGRSRSPRRRRNHGWTNDEGAAGQAGAHAHVANANAMTNGAAGALQQVMERSYRDSYYGESEESEESYLEESEEESEEDEEDENAP